MALKKYETDLKQNHVSNMILQGNVPRDTDSSSEVPSQLDVAPLGK
jgi:hypothetical protein